MERGSTGRGAIALRSGLAAALGLLPLALAACGGSGGTAATNAGTTTTAPAAQKAVTIRVKSVVSPATGSSSRTRS
jgi:hypothetical protein